MLRVGVHLKRSGGHSFCCFKMLKTLIWYHRAEYGGETNFYIIYSHVFRTHLVPMCGDYKRTAEMFKSLFYVLKHVWPLKRRE